MNAEIVEIVRDSLGRDPEPHEVGEETARILRVARAATRNADKSRQRWEAAINAQCAAGGGEKWRRDFAARMGVHYHEPIVRRQGTLDEAWRGEIVRVDDSFMTRSALGPMTGVVGTPMFGGLPAVELNRDLTPYRARGFSFDSGQFSAFYRSDSIVREAIADVIGVVAGATIEVQTHSGLTQRAAELLGVDRDEQDRIADIVNTELILGQWGGISGMMQELLRLSMVNGAIVYEFMLDASAPLGRRILSVSPRMPNTWTRWIQDPYTGEAVAIEQTNPNPMAGGGGRLLDLSRCIHVAIDQDGDNFEGLSLLRSARAWDVLGFEVSSAITLNWQRFAGGVPIIRHSGTGQASGDAARQAYEAFAKYANVSSAIIQVGAGVDVELLQMQMDTGFVEIIELCTRMKRAALRNSIANTGDGATGTYGWGEIKSQLWLRGLGTFVQPIERGFNNLVRQYIDTYIGPQPIYPTLKFTNFATRSSEEVLKTVNEFAKTVQSGVYTDVELVEIAEKADVPWNGRNEEGDEADGQTGEDSAVQTDAAPPSAITEPMSAQTILAASQVVQAIGNGLTAEAARAILSTTGFSEQAVQSMVTAPTVAPLPAEPTANPEPRAAEDEPDTYSPPSVAARAAAIGRKARAKSAEKWPATIAELALSKAVASQKPLSRLQLRELDAYFDGAAADAPYPDGSPEWQEWQCMGGDAMAAWLPTVLKDDPAADPEPETRGAKKYDHIDFTPPQGVRDAAKRALEVREKKPDSQRGMTATGIARARDLANGRTVSPDTARRMLAFFERHEGNKSGATWGEKGKGWQAWHGWGGDAGFSWARKLVKQMNAAADDTTTRAAHVHGPGCGCGVGCDVTTRAKRVEITVSGRGGGAYVTHRALTGPERSVAWADIQSAKDRNARRITRAVEREQRKMREEFLALAAPLIASGDAAGAAAITLDYTDRFRDAITPILASQARWSSSDMRSEIRDQVGRLPAAPEPAPAVALSRAEASATALAQQVQARTIEEIRNAAVAMATGTPAEAVAGAGLGFGRTSAALVVQAVSTTANAARVATATEQGPRIENATYSAVMDRYTCEPCAAADGTVVEFGSAEYDQLSPPNPLCNSVPNIGVNMCQCVWVYTFAESEPETRSARPSSVVHLYVGPPGAGKSTLARAERDVVVDRDAFVLADGQYRREGVEESLNALREAIKVGDVAYVTCALSASSRQALLAQIEAMGASVKCIEVTASDEWLRLVNDDRGERAIPWDQCAHLIDAWEPVGDGEFESVERVVTS